LYEIASGIGTPLTIDDATKSRLFGLYARVLVDVDMSEPLFESVVVEREGHALTVAVQYEKYPLYCANCKTLGHDIHSCFKLSSNNRNDIALQVPKKSIPHQVTKDTNNHIGTKEMHNIHPNVGMGTNTAGPSHVQFETDIVVSRAAGTKHSLVVAQSQSVIERHDPIEILASFENITQEGATDDVSAGPEIAVAAVTQPPLSLRNSFDMLTSDCELPHGEALLEDSDNFVDSLDLFNNISESDKGFPVKKASLEHRQKSKAPISFETRPSDFPLWPPTSR
jgi:hypothetical protein